MPEKAPLPRACAECVFWLRDGSLCHHGAPSPGDEQNEIAYWPVVKDTDRCGGGATALDPNGRQIIACEQCMHWHQPGGHGIRPAFTGLRKKEWWENSGLCTLPAPAPGTERNRKVYWRVTHATAGCGDGETVPEVVDDETGEITQVPRRVVLEGAE